MPTGYTAKLMEKGQEFPEFAMLCARAFGACVEMRDDSMDAPIPERFEPSDYHVKGRKESERLLATLENMDGAERLAYGQNRRAEDIFGWREALEKNRTENKRLSEMRAKVEAWTPPTKDHEELKKFMLQQIEISSNDGDYYEPHIKQAMAKEPLAYYFEAVEAAKAAVDRHITGHAEDVKRADSRTRWIKQLRDSLNPSP